MAGTEAIAQGPEGRLPLCLVPIAYRAVHCEPDQQFSLCGRHRQGRETPRVLHLPKAERAGFAAWLAGVGANAPAQIPDG